MTVPWEPDAREFSTPSSPEAALSAREHHVNAALTAAIRTVEEQMTLKFVQERNVRSFAVGYAQPPLGGGEAWIDLAVVPLVIDEYKEKGWRVDRDGYQLIFTLPEDA